jgi:tetratricopeptide (TPR) repeat protein
VGLEGQDGDTLASSSGKLQEGSMAPVKAVEGSDAKRAFGCKRAELSQVLHPPAEAITWDRGPLFLAPTPGERDDERVGRPSTATLVALAVFVALAAGVSPAHAWLDSGEIAAAAAELGVMHPTGVPGLMPLMHLASALPIGTLGFRFALVSAACGAATIAVLLGILQRREVPDPVLWICALWFVAGLTFSRQARVVEIYTFGSLLLAGTLWGFDPRAEEATLLRTRLIGVFCAVLGVWGFGDLRLALALPVAVIWFVAQRRAAAWSVWAPTVVVCATLTVFQIALSSARSPVSDWGDPDSALRLWQHLNAASIQAAFEGQILSTKLGPWIMHGSAMVERVAEDLGPLGPLAGLLGLVWLGLQGRERGMFWMLTGLLVVEVIYVVGINPMGGDDRQTGIPLALVVVLCVGLGLGEKLSEGGPRLWLFGPLVAVGLVLPAAFLSVPDFSVTRSWAPHAWARDQLSRVPRDALFVTQSDDLAAGLWAARRLEGARPDVELVVAQHLYRKLPDRALGRRGEKLLRPAFERCSEADRARALVGAYASLEEGPVIAESPGSDMLAALAWRSELSSGLGLALGEVRVGVPPDEGVAEPEAFVQQVRAEVDRLLPLLPTAEDRRRLATALSSRVRSWLRVAGHDQRHNAAAIEAYRILFSSLQIELPGPLVSLAALLDRSGKHEEAIALTRDALALDPNRRLALSNLALYLSRSASQQAEALELARRAADLYPRQSSVWRRLEQVCGQAGESSCAQEAAAQGSALAQDQRERARAACDRVGTSP